MEGHRFQLLGGVAELPDRHYLWQVEHRAILGGVLLFGGQHVWVADTPKAEQRAAWIALLDDMAALEPRLVVPGHRLPTAPADAGAIAGTREYLVAFEEELARAADGAALTEALVAPPPRPRHADRGADRRQGRHGRDDLGLRRTAGHTTGFAAEALERLGRERRQRHRSSGVPVRRLW
ncbi:hypothetical protein [Nonomuraea sp. NPDC050691]|uniref:hypothetical protein n=1 Tax=Nonomuraea sp. NPDC050691 TaxID=3155661 RepID=UPI0033DA8687